MTSFFLDTEFNSFGGELISIALVPEDTTLAPFYAVVGIPEKPHPWVAKHVLPVLNGPAMGLKATKDALHRYLWTRRSPITVYADWPEDHAHFLQLLCSEGGYMARLGRVICVLADPTNTPQPKIPHNALSDALALRDAWL